MLNKNKTIVVIYTEGETDKVFYDRLLSYIKTKSKGNKEKLQLALVLARESKIYILDEPIAGVDPAQREFIINTILASYAKNAVVIISTHLIEDIESILDRAIFVKYGHIVLDDSVNNICALHDNK